MILICYDGSDDARAAIQAAARLMPGHPATVINVWEPFTEIMARTAAGAGLVGGFGDIDEIDAASRNLAERLAAEGAALAHEAGIDARGLGVARHLGLGEAILGEADRLDVDAIVMGSRGRGDVKSALLGSASHAVMQHADRPVLVVPSPRVAEHRHALRHHSDRDAVVSAVA